MALTNCPECSKPVSTKAIQCPHCGYQDSHNQSKKNSNIVSQLLFKGILLYAVYFVGSSIWNVATAPSAIEIEQMARDAAHRKSMARLNERIKQQEADVKILDLRLENAKRQKP